MNAKKISFSGITNPMSNNEMRLTRGGEPLDYVDEDPLNPDYTDGDGAVVIRPCPKNGCSGPENTIINGQLCCLLPCFGWFHNYGYGYVSGMSRCAIV